MAGPSLIGIDVGTTALKAILIDVRGTRLDAFTRPRLAGYKRPRHYVVRDDLRRSAAGKADLRYLRDLAATELGRTP